MQVMKWRTLNFNTFDCNKTEDTYLLTSAKEQIEILRLKRSFQTTNSNQRGINRLIICSIVYIYTYKVSTLYKLKAEFLI